MSVKDEMHSRDAAQIGGWGRYLICYTVAFLSLALVSFLPFILNNKSLVYYDLNGGGDGLVIHYNSFVYYGRYLRSIILGLFQGNGLSMPMWDHSIGFGQDIIQTLWFYAVGDPFAFLSVLIPTRYSELGYCAVIILELWCAGLSFSFFARSRGNSFLASLAGALIYCFSAYPLLIVTLHPYFSLPMIFLPLLLVGVDRLMYKDFDILYVLTIMVSALSCIYFFYMLCIFVFLYAVYRYFTSMQPSFKGMLLFAAKYLLCSLLGIGMAAVLVLPIIQSMMGSTRATIETFVPLLYPINYYRSLPMLLMTIGGSHYNHEGLSALAPIAVVSTVVFASTRRSGRGLVLILATLYCFICIPFFGHVFNGFGYVTNRWIWAFGFFISYLVVVSLPKLADATPSEWRVIAAITSGIILFAMIIDNDRSIQEYANAGMLVIIIVSINFMLRRGYTSPHVFQCFILSAAFAAISVNAYLCFSPNAGNYIRYFGERGDAYAALVDRSPGAVLSDTENKESWRFDSSGINEGNVKRNSNILFGLNGTSHYYSTNSGDFGAFIRELEIRNPMEQTYVSLDRRAYLEALTSVRYVVVPNGGEHLLPHGFNRAIASNDSFAAYEGQSSLPIAFATDKIISRSTYEDADSIERQQLLLQGVVLEQDAPIDSLSLEPSYNHRLIEFDIVEEDGVELGDGAFIAANKGSSITVKLSGAIPENGELYVHFLGLDFKEPAAEGEFVQSLMGDGATSAYIDFGEGDRAVNSIRILNSQNPYYCGHHDFVINLGRTDVVGSEFDFYFSLPGTYSYDGLEFIYQPIDLLTDQVEELPIATVDNFSIGTNSMAGSVDMPSDGLVFISYLYSPGWKAFVDGEPVEILRADSSFMAFPVSAGSHTLELRYRTPLLYEGAAISLICLIAAFILQMRDNRNRNRIAAAN